MARPHVDRKQSGYEADIRFLNRFRAAIILDERLSTEVLDKLTEAVDLIVSELRPHMKAGGVRPLLLPDTPSARKLRKGAM